MKGISQTGEEQGYSLSPQDLPLSPRVQLVLEVLEGPSIEKTGRKKKKKPLNGNVLLFVTFMQRGGKEIGLSVYFDSRKTNPKAFIRTHTACGSNRAWDQLCAEPCAGISPPQCMHPAPPSCKV